MHSNLHCFGLNAMGTIIISSSLSNAAILLCHVEHMSLQTSTENRRLFCANITESLVCEESMDGASQSLCSSELSWSQIVPVINSMKLPISMEPK